MGDGEEKIIKGRGEERRKGRERIRRGERRERGEGLFRIPPPPKGL